LAQFERTRGDSQQRTHACRKSQTPSKFLADDPNVRSGLARNQEARLPFVVADDAQLENLSRTRRSRHILAFARKAVQRLPSDFHSRMHWWYLRERADKRRRCARQRARPA